jgi:hypothetical protein
MKNGAVEIMKFRMLQLAGLTDSVAGVKMLQILCDQSSWEGRQGAGRMALNWTFAFVTIFSTFKLF